MFMLNRGGLFLSFVFGFIFYFFGGLNSLVLMLVFLIISVFVTRFGYYEKKELGLYEYERGWKNVLSNALIPSICIIYAYLSGNYLPFIGSVAAIAADKFSSELGIFDEPFELLSLKKTKRGVSGGVSNLGFMASLVGSGIISISSYFLYGLNYNEMLLVIVAGFFGSLSDSIAGYFEERGFGSKETSNILGSLVGSIIMFVGLRA